MNDNYLIKYICVMSSYLKNLCFVYKYKKSFNNINLYKQLRKLLREFFASKFPTQKADIKFIDQLSSAEMQYILDFLLYDEEKLALFLQNIIKHRKFRIRKKLLRLLNDLK